MPPTFTLRPIGIIDTPWRTAAECPRNGRQPNPAPDCTVRVFPDFAPGLQSLDGFTHLILLYWLHETEQEQLMFVPPFDSRPRGIFATRGPRRPNPIGLSVVAFRGMQGTDAFQVRYLDCVNGTPLLDIKPYLPTTDSEPQAGMGWLSPHATRNKPMNQG